MAESGVRRSGRKRQLSTKASVDPFAELGLSDDEKAKIEAAAAADDSGDDFVAPREAESPSSEDDSIEDNIDEEAEEPNDEGGDEDIDDLVDFGEYSQDAVAAAGRKKKSSTYVAGTPRTSVSTGSRGLLDPRSRNSKEAIKLFHYGPDAADQVPAMQGYYRWKDEYVLPFSKPNKAGQGGYHKSFYEKEANRKLDMANDWKWYDEQGGREGFRHFQKTTEIAEEAVREYYPSRACPLSVIIGPVSAQRKYNLPLHGAVNLQDPFTSPEEPSRKTDMGPPRSGWILNVGQKVQAFCWVPNQSGNSQFFALSTVPVHTPMDGDKQPAFHPQRPLKRRIEIWELGRDIEGCVDMAVVPRVRQVICTAFGDVRILRWCPTPRKEEEGDSEVKRLGLLAGVFGDGSVRVLDVTVPQSDSPAARMHLEATAFVAKPPSSVFTSVCWTSSHAIIASTSHGYVAIFDVASSLSSEPARPILSSPLQNTYITSIITASPSRPHIILSSSPSGCHSMTDLMRVSTSTGINSNNTIYGPRARIGRQHIAWHDWSQMMLYVDEANSLQGLPLRRFFGYSGLMRFRAPATCLATSENHPFVAAGQTNGEVAIGNIMQKVMYPKETLRNARWFRHDWRRSRKVVLKGPAGKADGRGAPGSEEMEVDKEHDDREKDTKEDEVGVVRFVDGFKPEATNATRGTDSRNPNGIFATINEPQTAVTQVAWNPNISCGGWIAAGMASGLIRIEDVGVPR